jgi:large conductance mechanosensitive channel
LILLIDFKVKTTPAKQTVKPYNCNQKLEELNVSILQEFKEFAIKGNAIDMAVGIIVGAAFGKIISSLVADVFMPPVGVLIGGVDFTKLEFILKEAAGNVPAVTIKYGNFIQAMVDFTIIAFIIFMVVKLINNLKKKEQAAPETAPEPSKEELLLTEIRDLLKERK